MLTWLIGDHPVAAVALVGLTAWAALLIWHEMK